MTSEEYQHLAARTLLETPGVELTPKETLLVWNAIGLVGESGELADALKKMIFHRHGVDRQKLIDELGDVLWYISALCTNLEIPLWEVMRQNITKLKMRYPDGFSSEASKVKK